MPTQESLWEGECFVFDDRIAVKHGLEFGSYDLCRNCGHPILKKDKTSPQDQEGVTCPYCYQKSAKMLLLSEQKLVKHESKFNLSQEL